MAFDKITDADLVDKGVIGLPDVPNLNTAEMQKKFEEVCREVIIPKFNALIDALVADTAAGTLGSKTGLGGAEVTIQQCLDAAKTAILALQDAAHSHNNKTQLDTITSTLLANIDSVILLLSGITEVVDTVTDSSALIPSCKAIVAYVSELGAGDMLKATYDANNDNVADVAMEELTDFNGTPSDGQVPVYDSDSNEWKPQTPVTSIQQSSDVEITSIADNDILQFDDSDDKFKNVQPSSALSLSSNVPPKTATITKGLTDVLETIGSGASQAYSAGDIILCTDGYWYRASTDIAQNNTLVLNGNVTKTNQRALNTSLTQSLNGFEFREDSQSGKGQYSMDGGTTWQNFSSGGLVELIPQMTSDTAPSGVCSFSYTTSGISAYQMFDRNAVAPNGYFRQSGSWYLRYQFPSAKEAKAFLIIHGSTTRAMSEFKIQGSNDGTTWTDLGTYTGTGSGKYQFEELNTTGSYNYYQIVPISTYVSGIEAHVFEWQLFGSE